MGKVKYFLAGILCGCFLVTGVAFSAEIAHIRANVPDISLWFDGKELTAADDGEADLALPAVLEYQGVPYVQLPAVAEGLGIWWEWDREGHRIRMGRPAEAEFQLPDPAQDGELPEDIVAWIENSKHFDMAQHRTKDDSTWILITRGKKNTGGYEVGIDRIEQWGNRLKVHVAFADPAKGDLVTQAVTWPYALAVVKGTFSEVDYVETNGHPVSVLRGIGSIPSVETASERLILFSVSPAATGLRLEGAAQSFGGAVMLEVWDEDNRMVWKKKLAASAEMPDWGYFRAFVPAGYADEGNRIVMYVLGAERPEPGGDSSEQPDMEKAERAFDDRSDYGIVLQL